MNAVLHPDSWFAGWSLILCGFLSGAGIGLFFTQPEFWGGYGSLRRRLVRLGHIALVALGILNLLFALSPWPAPGTTAATVASTAFLIGGITMPLTCFLTAWRTPFRHAFFVPVTSLCTGAVTLLHVGLSS